MAAEQGEPAHGLITVAPLVDTNPGYAVDAWGENIDSLGLTPLRLLGELRRLFESNLADRNHWRYNPSRMPSWVIQTLPETVMVLATLDPLYKSQMKFWSHLNAEGIKVHWLAVDGLHMVKDMDQVTEAGRQVRQYVKQKHGLWTKRATVTCIGDLMCL